jgi:3-oxoacyl-[acyl-carrier protein] reductase
MDRPLDGKVAIVTGGSRGVGKGIVARLLRDGAVVVIGFRERADRARDLVAQAGASNDRAFAVQSDLSRLDGVRQLFERATDLAGGLDILVNNAALMHRATFADTTEEIFDSTMNLNVKGVFFAIQEAAHRMRAGGRIVNISSAATALAYPNQAVYSASKAAVDQLTRVAAKELAGRGITVNTVSPGAVETEDVVAAVRPEVLQQWRRSSGFGRLGQPEDIADVVRFLVGPEARWLTGQNLRATGGTL